MRRASAALPFAAGALAAATAGLGSLALVALNSGGAADIGGWRVMELAAGYDRAANAALGVPAPAPADRARAAALSRKAITLNPYDTAAWLRLAYIDTLDNGRLTPQGAAALKRSYDLVAFDPYVATWRVRFALEHWAAVPPDLRPEIRAEALALGGEWKHRDKILAVLAGTRNPDARLTAALWTSRIQRTVPR